MNYSQLAEMTAKRIHNPGINARPVLNSVYVDVTPDDDRTVKIQFGPGAGRGETRVEIILLDERKAALDTVGDAFDTNWAATKAYDALFAAIEVWYPAAA
ncbi:hypothetical protein ACWGKU_05130 [Kitasatospora sp. NPDC054768]